MIQPNLSSGFAERSRQRAGQNWTRSSLLELLGFAEESSQSRNLSPQAHKAQIFALLERLVVAAAKNKPVVMVVEDLPLD